LRHSRESWKVPKIEINAVSFYEAVTLELSGHLMLLIIEISLIVDVSK
jgi:hypothetical protein